MNSRLTKTAYVVAALSFALSGSQSQARRAYVFDDLWQEMQAMHEHMDKMHQLHQSLFDDLQKSPANGAKITQLQPPNVKTDITQNNDAVIVTFAFEATEPIDKKDVDITIENNQLVATIGLKSGKVAAYIKHDTLEVVRRAEVRQEQTKADKDKKEQTAQLVVGYADSSFAQRLPASVEVTQAKAEVKQHVLTLTLPKKKQVKIPVEVAA